MEGYLFLNGAYLLGNKFILTFDVEDWFQVENFRTCIPRQAWLNCELRVEENTNRLLDLLDYLSEDQNNGHNKIEATFFILGWIADRLPRLVQKIHDRGHEVASHGYNHEMCTGLSFKEVEDDLLKSKQLLEDICGVQVAGYRAPSFSINEDVLSIVEGCGYLYDSSYNSFSAHSRYGNIPIIGYKKRGIFYQISSNFFEIPVTNLKVGNFDLPWAGGGYFRLIPFSLFLFGIKKILKRQNAYVFYMHPWEIDSQQPKVSQAEAFKKFRHYVQLKKTYKKLSNLIKCFEYVRFISCKKLISRP